VALAVLLAPSLLWPTTVYVVLALGVTVQLLPVAPAQVPPVQV
jgi:hypothetical protein